jgi:cyanophycin synthetase
VRGQTTSYADRVSIHVASDKLLAYRLLQRAGLPVAEHHVVDVTDLAAATAFLHQVGGACVAKPAHGGGGAGVSGEIRTRAQLRRALVAAGRYDDRAPIERQAAGDAYRVLLLDGEVLDVLRRTRPTVDGDGSSTIEQLLFREHARRANDQGPYGLKPFVVDLDCLFTLETFGHTLRDVPALGTPVVVKTATNYNGPSASSTFPRPYPEALVEPAREAARVLGVRLAGVDIVTVDPSVPLAGCGGVILEVNPIPGLNHHYNVANPDDATKVCVPILRALLGA